MLMLGLNETMDQLVMANRVLWYGYVLKRVESYVLKTLMLEVAGQRKKGLQKRTW